MLIRTRVNIVFTIIGIVIILGVIFNYITWWSIPVIGCAWLGITTYGVVNITSGYFLKSYSNNPEIEAKTISITFDDGPDDNTLLILDILHRYDVKATFFCIGNQIEAHPAVAKEIIKQGHIIGNHTNTHGKWIDIYSTNKFTEEIIAADNIIKKYIGKTPRLFRPPYGVTNPNVARAVKKTGHKVIGWNKRSFDTTIPSEKVIFNRVTKNLKGGDVILLHDTKKITLTVLEQLLIFLQKNEYTIVTIDKLFLIEAYDA